MRAVLGASRWRLIRQLLTETTVIGLLGGAGGLLVAYWGLYGLLAAPGLCQHQLGKARRSRVLRAGGLGHTGWLFGLLPLATGAS